MMTDEMLISALTGPASSVLLLAGIGIAFGRFFTNTVVPATKHWVDKHLDQVDRLIAENAANREAWLDQMRDCKDQGERIEKKVGGLYSRHEALQLRIDQSLITRPTDQGVQP
jgi:hypothetical protein